MSESTYDLRRSGERDATRIDWLDSKHSFSFGQHYDPTNTHTGCCSSTTTTSSRRGWVSRLTRTATWRS